MNLEDKVLTCVNKKSFINSFNKISEKDKKNEKITSKFPTEDFIYKKVIEEFLKEHPEFIKKSN